MLRFRYNKAAAGHIHLPLHDDKAKAPRNDNLIHRSLISITAAFLSLLFVTLSSLSYSSSPLPPSALTHICPTLSPPPDFLYPDHSTANPSTNRTVSDRFDSTTTKDVILRNATLWTGEHHNSIIKNGVIWMANGVLRFVGPHDDFTTTVAGADEIDVQGRWVTTGIVDMHSHAGQVNFPSLVGTGSLNSKRANVSPYLKALDSFNTHDKAFKLVTAGGTTTSLILPGSGNAISGEAVAMKFRNTSEGSPMSMVVQTNGVRNMKNAFGENINKGWAHEGGTRQDTVYALRRAYASAQSTKLAQDAWCATASALEATNHWFALPSWGRNKWEALGEYPKAAMEEELLVETLRGKVKVHVHLYEAMDFDALERLSNEFSFPIASVQHAHEAWFSTSTLKKMFGPPPGVAMFATSSYYKHEAYRHSVFAPRIIHSAGLPVIFKSDHPPAVDSRYLLAEAAIAHYHGLDTEIAMHSVTSVPARMVGLDHRVGWLRQGYDADVVVWGSHPLTLGATPVQVYVDGQPQLLSPTIVPRSARDQEVPSNTANFTQQFTATQASRNGDVSIEPLETEGEVVFLNVSSIILRAEGKLVEETYGDLIGNGQVVVTKGLVVCKGNCSRWIFDGKTKGYKIINLMGGTISPGLSLYGTTLGLQEIVEEPSTTDGDARQLNADLPSDGFVPRTSDGLVLGGKETFTSLRNGITTAVTPPMGASSFKGLSAYFALSQPHRLAPGALMSDNVAFHVQIAHGLVYPATQVPVQVSTQIRRLRAALVRYKDLPGGATEVERVFWEIGMGRKPLVVAVSSADQMSTLIALKKEVEAFFGGSQMKMVFDGALEAHIIAQEIAEANIGVIARERGNPVTWDDRRVLPGAPLSNETLISSLRKAGVTVGVGMPFSRASTSILRFYLAYSMTDADTQGDTLAALSLATVNIENLLGLEPSPYDWVATEYGGLLDIGQSRIVAVGRGDGKVSFF